MIESKTSVSNDDPPSPSLPTSNNICPRLTNEETLKENPEQIISDQMEKMSQREKKMQERWSISTKNDNKNSEQTSNSPLLGIEFPQISVLRRKFTSSTIKDQKKTNSNPAAVSQSSAWQD